MVDLDNSYKYSKLIAVDEGNSLSSTQNYFLNSKNQTKKVFKHFKNDKKVFKH